MTMRTGVSELGEAKSLSSEDAGLEYNSSPISTMQLIESAEEATLLIEDVEPIDTNSPVYGKGMASEAICVTTHLGHYRLSASLSPPSKPGPLLC
ncbi:hypothetical protein HAX54_027543 [Datura stramonium]|uniref:Uncharacterized protein n=1 Tax=Datura stramonium TaxID=4076 RepID=A0ABS8V4M8_DATST|nr:hypothetical protein [Datura stramonium]